MHKNLRLPSALLPLWVLLILGCHAGGQVPDWLPAPVAHEPWPQHPYFAPNGTSNMHNDAYMSDTYEWPGPMGSEAKVTFQPFGGGINTCATLAFDSKGRIWTTHMEPIDIQLLLLDPDTLEVLASYELPPRDVSDPLYPYGNTGGPTYFLLDWQDRAILADEENALQIVAFDESSGSFVQQARFDLSQHMVPRSPPARDHLQMALWDWSGRWLWFTSRYGVVGTLDPETGSVATVELTGEEIQNSFAVAEDGAYIITDHAMYRFQAAGDGTPEAAWRLAYDRGTRIKPSNFNQGSGTTPQVFGDMVAFTDNAEPRMHVIFARRSDGSVACRIAVFPEGRSTTENALVGLVREGQSGLEYSVIVDNNYGIRREDILAEGRSWQDHEGGLVRVDALPDGQGGYRCIQVWHSPEKSSEVLPKLSLATGLLYVYTYKWMEDLRDYEFFLTAVDFRSGRTVFRVPTGQGLDYANFGQPMAIGRDGAAYLGTMGGLLRIADPR